MPNKNTICFKSHIFLDLPENEILEKVKKSIKNDNFIGQGTEAVVYRINDTDYCVRIPYEALKTLNFKSISKKISAADRVNHKVAKLELGTSIMRYYDGKTPNLYMNNPARRYELQEKIADMPIRAYTSLLHQIAKAVKCKFLFDYTGGNLIVNTYKNTLTAIDFYDKYDNPRKNKPLSEMYLAFTCYGSEQKTGKRIFNKIIDAGLEEFKHPKKLCMGRELFDFIDLCEYRIKSYNKKEPKLIKNAIAREIIMLKNTVKKVRNNKSYTSQIEQNIKKIKNLIKYIK